MKDQLWAISWQIRKEHRLYKRRRNVDRKGNKIYSGCTVIDYTIEKASPNKIKLEWNSTVQDWIFFFRDQYYIYPTTYNYMNRVNVFDCEIVKD